MGDDNKDAHGDTEITHVDACKDYINCGAENTCKNNTWLPVLKVPATQLVCVDRCVLGQNLPAGH